MSTKVGAGMNIKAGAGMSTKVGAVMIKFNQPLVWVSPVRQIFVSSDNCRKMKVATLVLALAAFVHADIYLHNPRLVRVCTVISAISSGSCELMCDVFPPFLYPTGARTIAWTRPEETETTQTGTWFFLLPQNTNLLGYNNNTKNANSCYYQ